MIYEEKDELYDIWLCRTRSNAYIIMGAVVVHHERDVVPGREQAAAKFQSDRGSQGRPRVLCSTTPATSSTFATNDTGRNFRLVTAPVASPGVASWKEIVPQRDNVMLEDVDCFKNFYVLSERQKGVPAFQVVGMADGRSHSIAFPEPVYVAEEPGTASSIPTRSASTTSRS
jgi:oligopeptidase B